MAVAAGDIVFRIARPMSGAEGVDELAMLRQGQTLAGLKLQDVIPVHLLLGRRPAGA